MYVGIQNIRELEMMRDQAGRINFLRLHGFQKHRGRHRIDARIDAGGLGGKIVLLPWLVS
jgi:hypothetical protein